MFSETVANSLSGQKLASKPAKSDPKNPEDSQPGIVTILDTHAIHGEVSSIFCNFPA